MARDDVPGDDGDAINEYGVEYGSEYGAEYDGEYGNEYDNEYDAVPGDLPARDAEDVPAGTPDEGRRPAGDADDPVAAELGAVFAAALADEPESVVTPLSVLHAVRDERRRREGASRHREWVMWRWGGGILAAAAIGALLAGVAYVLSSHGVANTTAGASLSSSSAGSPATAAAGPSAGEAAADSASSAGPNAAYRAAPSAAPSAEIGAAAGTADGAASGGSGAGAGAGTEIGPESAPRPAAAAAPSAAPAAPSSAPAPPQWMGAQACTDARTLPPLSDAETAAVAREWGGGLAMAEMGVVSCDPSALRGLGVAVGSTELFVVVANDAGGSSDTFSTGAPTAAPAAPAANSVTVRGGGLSVTASAEPAGQTRMSHAQLTALADAVLAASH